MSDQREAPGLDARGVRGPHRRPARPRTRRAEAVAGCTHVIHLAAIVGGIANFHKLPHTLLEVNNGLYNAVFRAALDERRRAARLRVLVDGVRAGRRSSRPPRSTLHDCPAPRSAYGFSKLAGEVYCRALHDEHGLPFTICRPFNAYGPGEMPDDEPGIAHVVPDLIRKVLVGPAPAADLRLRRADAHADPRRRHRGRDRHRARPSRGGERGLQHLRVRGAHRRRDRPGRLGGLRRDPAEFELEHLPSFEVDVQRRWPSVEKARGLLGWEARIGLDEGIARTTEWVREQVALPGR